MHTLGEIGRKRQPHDTRGDSVSQSADAAHHGTTRHSLRRSNRSEILLTSPRLSRDSFSFLFFSFFFSFFFLENSKEPEEVREEGLFLENNLFRFFDIILRGDDFFFFEREFWTGFFRKRKWNCDAFQRFFRTFAREI